MPNISITIGVKKKVQVHKVWRESISDIQPKNEKHHRPAKTKIKHA